MNFNNSEDEEKVEKKFWQMTSTSEDFFLDCYYIHGGNKWTLYGLVIALSKFYTTLVWKKVCKLSIMCQIINILGFIDHMQFFITYVVLLLQPFEKCKNHS